MKIKSIFVLIYCFLFLINCNNKETIKKYYPNGSLKAEYKKLNGVIEGEVTMFYPSGKVKYHVNVKNGLREGVEKVYYENGKIRMIGSCTNDKEQGWYYYYDIHQIIDTIKEYILINPEGSFNSYMNDSIPNSEKESMSNRYLVYDKNRKIDRENSLYFKVKLKKDTIHLGDTLYLLTDFFTSKKHKSTDVIVSYYNPTINTFVDVSTETGLFYYAFVPNKKGSFLLKGTVNVTNNKETDYLYFHKKYFVK